MSGDQLREHAKLNNLVYVQSLLAGGANPCSTDNDGLTALHFAAFSGHHSVLCLLLSNDVGTNMDTGEKESSRDMRSDSGYTPLMLAVMAGGSTTYGGCGKGTGEEMFCVRELVMNGAAIDVRDALSRTAMDIAKEVENVEAYEYLSLEPPTEEAITETRRVNKERDEVKRTPNFMNMESAPRDPVTGKPIVMREDKLPIPPELTMDRTMSSGRAERGRFTSDLQVSFDQSKLPNGQFFPYEIFGDAYGQRIIPENVGNVQTFMNEQVFKVLTVDGMIKNLRRNRVLRDAWGSFFVHPFTLEINANEGIGAFPGDVSELERLIHATREYGYEFIDLPSWLRDNTLPLKPPSIEVPP